MNATNQTEQAQADGAAPRPSIVALLGGVLNDLRTLAEQQVQMAVHEVQMEIGRLKTILRTALGLLVVAQALIGLLILALVAALHEFAGLSWMLSAALVGAILLVGGAVLAWYVKQQLGRLRLYPARSLHTIKEDVRWITQLVSQKM
ncbi:MAG: phage holin family protein [Nitrospiraceae bacterium]